MPKLGRDHPNPGSYIDILMRAACPFSGLSGVADTGGGVAEAHKGVVEIGGIPTGAIGLQRDIDSHL
jgi:hypothetical protein